MLNKDAIKHIEHLKEEIIDLSDIEIESLNKAIEALDDLSGKYLTNCGHCSYTKKRTTKEDLAVADRIDNYVSKLTQGDDISSGRMSKEEYIEIVSSLRYAISSLRGGNK